MPRSIRAARPRFFNVAINGALVLRNFDLFAAAGGKDIAVVKQFTRPADSSGEINIQFTTVLGSAVVNGIEVLATDPSPTPTATATPRPTATITPTPTVPPTPGQEPLLHQSNLQYIGAFRVPNYYDSAGEWVQ